MGLHINPPKSICGHDKINREELCKNARGFARLGGPVRGIVERKIARIVWLILEKKGYILFSRN